MASPYRLPGGEPGIGGCKRKIGRGIAHPLGRRSSAPRADHRRSAQAAPGDARKTGETRFFDCWGRKGNPFGPLKTAPVPARRNFNLLRGAEQRSPASSPPRRTIPHEHEMFEPPRAEALARLFLVPRQRSWMKCTRSASAIATPRGRRRRGCFVSAGRARIERDPKETQRARENIPPRRSLCSTSQGNSPFSIHASIRDRRASTVICM